MSDAIHTIEERLRLDPDDEASWQVYGDWLQQQGDARGELIAVELAALASDDPALAERAQQLATDQFLELGVFGSPELEWRHGFVVAVEEPALEFPSDVDPIARLLSSPWGRLLSTLALGFERWSKADMTKDEDRAGTLPAVAKLDLGSVRTLRFAYSPHGDALVDILVAAEGLAPRELDLRHAKLTDASAQALATCEGLRGLRVLHLHGNAIGPEGARALAASKVLENLEILDLRGNRIRIEGARALASSPIVRGLEFLHLDPEDINNVDGLEALAASKQLPRDLVRLWRARRDCVER